MTFPLLSIFHRNFLHSTEKYNFVMSFKSLLQEQKIADIELYRHKSIFKMSLSFHIISKYIVLSLCKVKSILNKLQLFYITRLFLQSGLRRSVSKQLNIDFCNLVELFRNNKIKHRRCLSYKVNLVLRKSQPSSEASI